MGEDTGAAGAACRACDGGIRGTDNNVAMFGSQNIKLRSDWDTAVFLYSHGL